MAVDGILSWFGFLYRQGGIGLFMSHGSPCMCDDAFCLAGCFPFFSMATLRRFVSKIIVAHQGRGRGRSPALELMTLHYVDKIRQSVNRDLFG